MSRKDIREYLKNNILLFDGAMGTYLTSKDRTYRNAPEAANIEKPDLIRDIHTEYLQAGSMAITTNTFGANRQNFPDDCDAIIEKGYRLAEEAASKYNAFVFADIGPMDIGAIELPEDVDESEHEYIRIAGRFLEMGASNFLFETQSIPDGIPEAARFIKEKNPDAFIIASFAVLPDGFTRDGVFASQLAEIVGSCPFIDAFGMNCIQDAVHMKEMASRLELNGKSLSLMPNAGYPTVLSHRVFYEGDPAFYAQSVADMANVGARILGGCCGTTPLHIKMISKCLPRATGTEGKKTVTADETADTVTSHFWQKLTSGGRPIAVELDPPENASLSKFMAGATKLRDAGVDILTIADCPIARARMDSSLLACKVRRELELDVIPHMTCRDRNLNATKALLLGLYAESVRNVLLVTGDPIPTAERDEVKSVYQFNSRKLTAFVSELGRQTLPGGFHIFGALNVNARNFDVQLKLAKEKVSKGMVGFLTQPVLTDKAVQNLKRAKEELDAYILGGLIPIISERNARFMDSEVNGISVSPEIIRQYEGKNRAQSENLAVEITRKIAKEIEPYVDGYYIITPFNRTSLIERILKELGY
ncbi:MAG: bifunctional homocysteine S-methyltransferase/methylenetetrahydrofolate reductase [Spirochaetales bacterium]|nr:bifunctional homocysteine S-methyltransferase/methylenetetrahydrofolate reductase [Spirochaetales bacterium]